MMDTVSIGAALIRRDLKPQMKLTNKDETPTKHMHRFRLVKHPVACPPAGAKRAKRTKRAKRIQRTPRPGTEVGSVRIPLGLGNLFVC